uniref:Uncharacterized protein n=1 Tax=Amphimedon queenslandica TaxID=400682 RepID=A0A1X7V9Q1_AMPQE
MGVYDITVDLTTDYSVETLLSAPTAPVDDIIFSTVLSVSMTVSWDEVPCNGRNGPITGYYLTYTNITSDTSYTVNITGGDNRMYHLTGLIPYTNYTVSILPYNYDMTGPSRQEIQLTAESIPGVIFDLMQTNATLTGINISWSPPTIPNGPITVYEIRYRESTSTGPYNITNTTNEYYSIVGLIPNISYTIGVRAYTSIGPGEWTDRQYITSQIHNCHSNLFYKKLSSTAVRAEWGSVAGASDYTVYYESTSSSSRKKRLVETGMRVFPGDTTEGLIGGLDPNLNYSFSISISFNVNGIIYEGERTQPIPPGFILTLSTTITYSTETTPLTTALTTVLVNIGATTGVIVGSIVVLTLLLIDQLLSQCMIQYKVHDLVHNTALKCVFVIDMLRALLLLAGFLLWRAEGQEPNNLPSNDNLDIGIQLYLPYVNRIILDYSMIYASQFYDVDQNNDVNDINDALWCQSANNGTNIGVWYYPNGTEVPLIDGDFDDPSGVPEPLFSKRFSGQIALARSAALSGYEGLYKCIIPDENGVNHTLVVGAYTDTGYNNNDGPDADPTMQFSLLSTSRLATPPVFSLSFNVSDGPPTTVSCSVNGNGISTELSRVIVNGPGSATRVTVTVRLRKAGNYQCTVSNERVTNGTISGVIAVNSTSSFNISVSDTPTGLTATRLNTGLSHVRLSWSAVSGATGYEVYYQLHSNAPFAVTTTSTTIIIVGLPQGISYGSAFLPSGNASAMLKLSGPVVNNIMSTVTISAITLTWSPPTAVLPISYNINRNCSRVCESSFTSNSETSVSSPHTSTGIPPYSQCGFDLIGVYGAEIAYLTADHSVTTISTAPTAPVGDVIFSSVESVSMTVSWDEVPCNGRNGPITGYYLTYTNITSNTTVIQTFSITKLNSTAVRAEWGSVPGASHYTVYYESTNSSGFLRKKRQVETGMRVFPGDATEGLIGGLDPNLNYLFSISISFNVNGIIYEGERTQPIPPASSTTISYSVATTAMPTVVNNGENIWWIIGAAVLVSLLAIPIIVILIVMIYIKRTNNNRKRQSDNDIVMECSPAYATAEFKTKSTVEPVYDTTNNEYETPLPPPSTEYELLTI